MKKPELHVNADRLSKAITDCVDQLRRGLLVRTEIEMSAELGWLVIERSGSEWDLWVRDKSDTARLSSCSLAVKAAAVSWIPSLVSQLRLNVETLTMQAADAADRLERMNAQLRFTADAEAAKAQAAGDAGT